MLRKIIRIDEEKCSGCGACAAACHEGAISMVNGKARLMREDYCDGLGDCLPACPTDAISFEVREAPAYDEAAVKAAKAEKAHAFVCPGTRSRSFERTSAESAVHAESCLTQWPVQIKLLPVKALYFEDADILIAADCTAYAYGNFHQRFIKDRITLIGCPKLDEGDYTEKLTAIFRENEVRSVTVARMEVPCCGGLERAVKMALMKSGRAVPCAVTVITTDGRIIGE